MQLSHLKLQWQIYIYAQFLIITYNNIRGGELSHPIVCIAISCMLARVYIYNGYVHRQLPVSTPYPSKRLKASARVLAVELVL